MLVAEKIFLNVGTHAAIPDVPGLKAAQPLTHIEALELDYLPQHLIVIGGGYAGLEFAQAYRRFGSNVSVVESGPQLVAREDIDVSREMRRFLSDEGIQVLVETELLQAVGRSGDKVALNVRTASGEHCVDGSDILVAVGAFPTPLELDLRRPALNWTAAVTFASMADWRRVGPTCGRWANAPAAHNSRTYPKMIFASFATISPETLAARAIDWFLTACLPSRRSLTSD